MKQLLSKQGREITMQVLPLESNILYGPLYSRRLNRSLGINLLPTERKVCPFDCVYCHYGATDVKTLAPNREGFPETAEVIAAVETGLQEHPNVDHLTFSGNGEPTLHPNFPEIATGVHDIRNRVAPNVKLAIYSNATTLDRDGVRESLKLFDAPILKLDAADPKTFQAVNRPTPTVEVESIIDNLKALPQCIIQSVFIQGGISNVTERALDAWIAALEEIQPEEVQIYSSDYPVPEQSVERVPPYVLERIAKDVRERTGLDVVAYWF
jgi:wyosine [tRNA(Phe)-imidazoG37] synthetase (radical SAM superfamily)